MDREADVGRPFPVASILDSGIACDFCDDLPTISDVDMEAASNAG
jgi:hypothetical protein